MENKTEGTKKITPIAEVGNALIQMKDKFRASLPKHMLVEKFVRVATTAIANNPELLNTNRVSLYTACIKAAQDGLLLDGKESALVIFGKTTVYMPMIYGVLKKIRNSGELAKIEAHVVYERDTFKHVLGDEESIIHEVPPFNEDRGKAIGAYSVATLKDGQKVREVMSFKEIELVRAVSKASSSGPWKTWWGEMAKKTVIRRLSKRLPMSTDLEDVIHRDDEMYDLPNPEPTPAKTQSDRLSQIVEEQAAPPIETAPVSSTLSPPINDVEEPPI